MTVGELIEKLSQLPQDVLVVTYDQQYGEPFDVERVEFTKEKGANWDPPGSWVRAHEITILRHRRCKT